MSTETLLRMPAVVSRVGLKRAAIYARIETGDFPQPVAIGIRAVAWPSSDIDNWIAERIGERITVSRPKQSQPEDVAR